MFKYFYSIIIILALSAIGMTTLFLYNNFYKTLAQTKEVNELFDKVSFATLNNEQLAHALSALKNKQNLPEAKPITSPF